MLQNSEDNIYYADCCNGSDFEKLIEYILQWHIGLDMIECKPFDFPGARDQLSKAHSSSKYL